MKIKKLEIKDKIKEIKDKMKDIEQNYENRVYKCNKLKDKSNND